MIFARQTFVSPQKPMRFIGLQLALSALSELTCGLRVNALAPPRGSDQTHWKKVVFEIITPADLARGLLISQSEGGCRFTDVQG